MSRLDVLLRSRSVVLLDGGLASELERHGHDLRDPLWSAKLLLEDPAAIARVHRDYLGAGADIITTATYQATFAGLAARGLDARAAAERMRLAVRLGRDACAAAGRADALVAASVGSYGAFLADGSEYRGDYALDVDALVAFHLPRLEVLAPLADVIACETVPCLAEARALARCLSQLPDDVAAWVAFSCRDERAVCHGEPLAECVAALLEVPQLAAVGINCTAPAVTAALVARARAACAASRRPPVVIAYPNSGERYDGSWHGAPTSVEAFAALAADWVAAGARIVGGCCRTGPEHIAALRALRETARESSPSGG